MYFGEDYTARCGVVVRQPTIGEILEIGENKFYSSILGPWITNPTQYRLMLWNVGIDWNKISDFDLFRMLYKSDEKYESHVLFPGMNFAKLDEYQKTTPEGETTIILSDGDFDFSEDDYLEISEYLRLMFNIFPKVEKAKGRTTKEIIIQEDEEKLRLAMKEKKSSSTLMPLVSACVNHPGFKYRLKELKEVGICEFMDSVQRLQVYENSVALMSGAYSGFVDTKGIPKENFDFMRDLIKT